jgi:peptidylprolyl isomerase
VPGQRRTREKRGSEVFLGLWRVGEGLHTATNSLIMSESGGGAKKPSGMHCFLDIDINDHRAAYALACLFVKENDTKYGFTTKVLAQMGGSERARLSELFEADYAYSARGRIELSPAPCERIVIDLHTQTAPTCCENFLKLCTGEKGRAKGSGLPLHYKGSVFHRMVAGQFIQGGDFTHGNGAGGESIWGSTFKDDPAALKPKVDRRGLVCMSNTGKNSNGSQFFITLAPLPKLSSKHCVFGEVVQGLEVLELIERLQTEDEKPAKSVRIVDCGKL